MGNTVSALYDVNRYKELLSLKYDIEIVDITPLKNVMRISTNQGDKCFKRSKFKKDEFLFIFSAMKHLEDKGFESLVPIIPCRDGEYYIELDEGFGYLTDWVQSRECSYSNPVELKMAVEALAKLHRASENFNYPMELSVRIGWGKWIEKFKNRIREMMTFREIISSKEKLTYFDRVYSENFNYYLNQAVASIEHLKDTKYLELSLKESEKKSFCHHDYAHHNVLISKDFKVYIIDFDYCICDTRLHDLSSVIIRNMRHGNWNMEKAQYIIDCYLKEGYVEKDEIPVMNAFMEFPQDFWQVGLQYYIEKQKWEEKQFIRRLHNCIDDKQDRQEFIEEFKWSIHV